MLKVRFAGIVRDTPLLKHAERRLKTPTGRITEDEISKHAYNLRRKKECDKKTSGRNQTDNTSVVLSVRSNLSRKLRVRMPVKTLTAPPPSPTKSPKTTIQQQQETTTANATLHNPFSSQQQDNEPIATVPVGPRRSKCAH